MPHPSDLNFDPKDPKAQSRTQASHAQGLSVGEIMRRYTKTGVLPTTGRQLQYGDFRKIPVSLSDALNLQLKVKDHFMSLPSQLRLRFKNDPLAFAEFVSNPENLETSEKLGLVRPSDKEVARRKAKAEAEAKVAADQAAAEKAKFDAGVEAVLKARGSSGA